MDDLISRRMANDALWKALYEYEDKTEKQFIESDELDVGDWIQHSIFVQNMSDIDRQTILNLPSAQPEQRWIPVSERLPEDVRNCYWVCTDTGYQCQCRWTNINHIWTDLTTNWHWHMMDIPQYSRVVAWRELPKPYEEEKDG